MGDTVNQFTVFFEGRVQGVGFRFSTYNLAKGFEVTGYVKNLVDGRVQLELEGKCDECLAFIRALSEEMGGFIRGTEQTEKSGESKFIGFTIQ